MLSVPRQEQGPGFREVIDGERRVRPRRKQEEVEERSSLLVNGHAEGPSTIVLCEDRRTWPLAVGSPHQQDQVEERSSLAR